MKKVKKILNHGPTLIILAAVLWALDGIIRRSLFTLPPIIIVFYEHLAGLIILLPLIIKKLRKTRPSLNDFLLIILISLLSGVLGTLWFTTALIKVKFISFSVVFLLQKLQPIFAILTAVIFLKEKIDKRYLKWAGLALTSAFFVTFKNGYINFHTGVGTITAALYAVGAAFAWGSSTTFSKIILKKYSHTFATSLRFLFTTFFAFVGIFLLRKEVFLLKPTFSQYLRFIFIAISTGMVALLIYYKGLKKTKVKVSTILELTFPMLAIIIDMVLYKNFLSFTQWIATGFLLLSIYQVSKLNYDNNQ